MNGMVRPVSGMTRVTPPTTTKHCSATEKARPTASSLPKPSRTPSAVRRPRSTRSTYSSSSANRPDQAELLTEAREDEVALGEGGEVGPALPEPGAEQPAGGHAHEALGQLVGLRREAWRERVEPQVDALLDVAEDQVCEVGAGGEQHQADGDPATPLGGDVEHRDEQAEEQQRRAEVLLEDEDGEAEPARRRGSGRGRGRAGR